MVSQSTVVEGESTAVSPIHYFIYFLSSINNHVLFQFKTKGVFIWKKTSQLQPGQPGTSVSWDDLNFRLHGRFCPGLQGWIQHVVLFGV